MNFRQQAMKIAEILLRNPFPAQLFGILAKCPVKLTYIVESHYADTPVPKNYLRSGENGDSVTHHQNVLAKQTWIFVWGKVRTAMFSSPNLQVNRPREFSN